MNIPIPDDTLDADLAVIDLDAFRRKREATFCLHNGVDINSGNRTATCRKCGAVLDPFDLLVKLTAEWERVRELASLRKRLQAHIEELNRQAANARQRARHAGATDLPYKPI
jgi:hypothetical protein